MVVVGEVLIKYLFNFEGIVKKVFEFYGMIDVMVMNFFGV